LLALRRRGKARASAARAWREPSQSNATFRACASPSSTTS
jgi:hypothetical protein